MSISLITWQEHHYLCPSMSHKVYEASWQDRTFRVYVDMDHDETWNLVFSLGTVEGQTFRLIAQQTFLNANLSSVQPFCQEALNWAESLLRSPMEWLAISLGEAIDLAEWQTTQRAKVKRKSRLRVAS